MLLLLLFVGLPLLVLLLLFFPRRGLFPGPTQFGVLKASIQMVLNLSRRHHWHDDLRARYGPVVDVSVPGKPTLLLFEPADIELTFNRKLAPDRQRLDGFATAFAKGLVGMPMDDTWARHRRLLAPLFSERMMDKYRLKIDELAEKLSAIVASNTVDVVPLLGAFALDVIGSCGFGTSFDALDAPDAASNVFVQAAASLLSQVDRMTVHPWLGSRSEIQRSSVPFDEQVDRARLEASALRAQFNMRQRSARNMLMHLIDAEERGELTPSEVSDESRTIMVAGAETTGLTISWTLYFMRLRATATYRSTCAR